MPTRDRRCHLWLSPDRERRHLLPMEASSNFWTPEGDKMNCAFNVTDFQSRLDSEVLKLPPRTALSFLNPLATFGKLTGSVYWHSATWLQHPKLGRRSRDKIRAQVQLGLLRILRSRSQRPLWILETVSLWITVSRDHTDVQRSEAEFSTEPEAVAEGTWEVNCSRSEADVILKSSPNLTRSGRMA